MCESAIPSSASASSAGSARKATVSDLRRPRPGREPVHAAPWTRSTRRRRSSGRRSTARGRYAVGAEGRGEMVLGRMTARVSASRVGERCVVAPGRSARTAGSSSQGRRSSPRTASPRACSPDLDCAPLAGRQRDHEPAVVVVRRKEVRRDGFRARHSYGSRAADPSFGRPTPARRRSATRPRGRTPRHVAPDQVRVPDSRSARRPAPTASTRASRSQTTNPVSGAG